MPINVIVHDTRLAGRTPASSSSFANFDVGEDTPLQEFLEQCQTLAEQYSGISTLYIMAHGVEIPFGTHVGGGYGIMFCREYIHLDNVTQFSVLAEKVDQIVLLVCSAAAVSFDIHHVDLVRPELSRVYHGDGNELCRQMAISAEAPVTAARELQAYATDEHCMTFAGYELFCSPGVIDFGDWEGSVVQFDADGNVTAEWTNPSAWRDPHGRVHDPRLETRP